MSLSRADLKELFQTGATPSEADFANLIDSCYNTEDDASSVENRNYVSPTVSASALSVNFGSKREVWADKSGGGGIDVSGDISLNFINSNIANIAYIFLNLSADSVITFDRDIETGDSRYQSSDKGLRLLAGRHCVTLMFSNSATNRAFMLISSKEQYKTKSEGVASSSVFGTFPANYYVTHVAVKVASGTGSGSITVSTPNATLINKTVPNDGIYHIFNAESDFVSASETDLTASADFSKTYDIVVISKPFPEW